MKISPYKPSEKQISDFLEEMTFGFLSTLDKEGSPNIKPVNYVFHDGNIYFHGKYGGEKAKESWKGGRVCFAVANEYSYIPSYAKGGDDACPATVFFKSVILKGEISRLKNLEKKAEVLTVLMKKMQPEMRHRPITPKDPEYLKTLKMTAVFEIKTTSISGKFKFGQNQDEDNWNKIHQFLDDSKNPLADKTSKEMDIGKPGF